MQVTYNGLFRNCFNSFPKHFGNLMVYRKPFLLQQGRCAQRMRQWKVCTRSDDVHSSCTTTNASKIIFLGEVKKRKYERRRKITLPLKPLFVSFPVVKSNFALFTALAVNWTSAEGFGVISCKYLSQDCRLSFRRTIYIVIFKRRHYYYNRYYYNVGIVL